MKNIENAVQRRFRGARRTRRPRRWLEAEARLPRRIRISRLQRPTRQPALGNRRESLFSSKFRPLFTSVCFVFQMNQKVQVSYHALLSSQDESNQVFSSLVGDTGRLEW